VKLTTREKLMIAFALTFILGVLLFGYTLVLLYYYYGTWNTVLNINNWIQFSTFTPGHLLRDLFYRPYYLLSFIVLQTGLWGTISSIVAVTKERRKAKGAVPPPLLPAPRIGPPTPPATISRPQAPSEVKSEVEIVTQTPPFKTVIPAPPPTVAIPEVPSEPQGREVFVGRGGDFQGGRYLYKVKVQNLTEFTITNVVVSIISYPDECLKLLEPPAEEKGNAEMRRYKRIPPNDFVTATFEFTPYKDCIKGEIQSSVHYYDVRNELHDVKVEAHPVKIVCDLLSPLKVGVLDFDAIITSWSRTGEEQKLDGWNPRDFFNTATSALTSKNFSVLSADSTLLGTEFFGAIKCLAKGVFTGKRVGLVVYVRGSPAGRISLVKVEAVSEDEAQVLPVFNEVMETFRHMPRITLVAQGDVVLGGKQTVDVKDSVMVRSPIQVGDRAKCQGCGHDITPDQKFCPNCGEKLA